MTDAKHAAREDLAFLRSIAEDRGAPHSAMGAQVFAIGLIYGINMIAIWAAFVFQPPLPEDWFQWSWAPGAIVYIPACLWLSLRNRGDSIGPTTRIFIAAWAAVGVICLPIVALMVIAQMKTGVAYVAIWPPLAFLLFGGAWAALGIVRRKLWHGAAALGCLATALVATLLIGEPASWLAMGVGLILFMGVPGFALMRAARKLA